VAAGSDRGRVNGAVSADRAAVVLRRRRCVPVGTRVFLLADPPLHEYEYPTLSYLLQPIVDQPAGRGLLLVVWIAVGLALLRWSQGGITKAAARAGPSGHTDASGDGRADPDIGA